MIRVSYDLLGLISFLTTGPDETRAWTIRKGISAVDAAAKIRTGSIAEARKQGNFRTEGKTYIMQDGDVVNFLFNV